MISPAYLGLPVDSWREGQYEGILQSLNSTKRFVTHCAPTGSGKMMLLVGEARISKKRTLILTGTHTLQKQYTDDFKSLGITDIKGKSNYTCRATELGGEWHHKNVATKSVAEGPCQFGVECGLRQLGCIYYDKVRTASNTATKIVVSNYAAWISSNLYGEGWGYFHNIFLDEAHESSHWLGTMLTIRLSKALEEVLETTFPGGIEPKNWRRWAAHLLPEVKGELGSLEESSRIGRKARSVSRTQILQHAVRVLDRLKTVEDDWLVTEEKQDIVFRPIWVKKYAESLLFGRAEKVVLASATVVPYELKNLGIAEDEYDFFSYPSSFPVERRPIYFYPAVRMSYDFEDPTEWIPIIDNFISKRLDRKGVIHTVSHSRTRQLLEHSKYSSLMVASPSSSANTSVLQQFRMMKPPAILVGPGWGTGINLTGNDARYAIIPKVPFEPVNDPVIAARTDDDPDYPFHQAAKRFVQYYGRTVRDITDWSETLVTDSAFGLYTKGRYRNMIADWVQDAVVPVSGLPEPMYVS